MTTKKISVIDRAMAADLPGLERHRALIGAIAASFGLEPAVAAGVVSRESGGGRLLGRNGCPPDTGDRGHGRGLMQIDDRWHRGFIGLGELWRTPAANLAYGCHLLAQYREALRKRLPGLTEEELLRAALAAYNSGTESAERLLRAGGDPDAGTTGGNYGRDVLARAEWLRARGW